MAGTCKECTFSFFPVVSRLKGKTDTDYATTQNTMDW